MIIIVIIIIIIPWKLGKYYALIMFADALDANVSRPLANVILTMRKIRGRFNIKMLPHQYRDPPRSR